MKKSVSRKFLALALIPIIAFAFTIPVSASTPESPITVFKEYADILSSTVDKDTSYDLSALDLSTLPAYMEEVYHSSYYAYFPSCLYGTAQAYFTK